LSPSRLICMMKESKGMAKYYCHPCASSMGMLRNIHSSAPIASKYQLEKYLKHTAPSSTCSHLSIFDDPSTGSYRNAIVAASCSGSVEIDVRGRKNIIYVASTGRIGCSFQNGVFLRANNTIKVVLSSDPEMVHAFTESSTQYSTALCEKCGSPIIY
jgi:hypothetical protein